MTARAGLQVQGLSAAYGDYAPDTIRDVAFDLAPGSLTALLGPSGCGKSTVLRVLAGLHPARSGRIVLQDQDISALPPEQRPIAVVLQGGAVFPHLSVLDNVLFPLAAQGLPPTPARARALDALALVGLGRESQRFPSALAGGQRQLLALARAIAQAPALLLLDEPLSNVDPRLRRSLRDEIRAIQQRLDLTLLYVTHDQAEAIAVSDHLVLMDAGTVVEAGTPQQLYRHPRTRFAATFMGDATTLAGMRDADGAVCVDALVLPQMHPGPPGPVEVAIRPEAWRIAHVRLPGLPGTVAKRHFLGRLMEYQVDTPRGRVLVHLPYTGVQIECGAPVSLQIALGGAAWVLG